MRQSTISWDSESLQIARLLFHKNLLSHYRNFLRDIVDALTNENYKTILSQASLLTLSSEGNETLYGQGLLSYCFGEIVTKTPSLFLQSRGEGVKEPGINENSKLTILIKDFAKIEEALEKVKNWESLQDSERAFRAWLQRAITMQASFTEPDFSFFPGENSHAKLSDPLAKASQRIIDLENLKPLHQKNQSDEIFFPFRDIQLFNKTPRIPIGINPFDTHEWGGGPEYDSLTTLCGESNVGKTMMGLYLMSCIASQKKNVLIVSGEDSPMENKRRLLAYFLKKSTSEIENLTEIEIVKIMNQLYGDLDDKESLHYHLKHKFLSICPDEGKLTPQYIQEKVKEAEDKISDKIHAIMVDYLQKATLQNQKKISRDEELEFVVNLLKENGEGKYMTLLISQIPSHAAGGNYEFLGIRQATARSYAATWGAHYIITINRPKEETERIRTSQDKRICLNLFLCKNKNGPIGTCYAIGYPAQATWQFFRTKDQMQRAFSLIPNQPTNQYTIQNKPKTP